MYAILRKKFARFWSRYTNIYIIITIAQPPPPQKKTESSPDYCWRLELARSSLNSFKVLESSRSVPLLAEIEAFWTFSFSMQLHVNEFWVLCGTSAKHTPLGQTQSKHALLCARHANSKNGSKRHSSRYTLYPANCFRH